MTPSYTLLLVTLVITVTFTQSQPRGRGTGLLDKILKYNPEYMKITDAPPENPHVPKKRRTRGEIIIKKLGVEFETTPATTTSTTTTLSPEQIEEEKRKRQEKEDPKNFLQKLKKFGIEDEDITSEEETITTIDGEVKKMHKKLHEKLKGCNDNSECFNSTCCFKEDPTKRGECILKPHKLNDACSDMCGCTGQHEEIDLECKTMELSKQNEKSEVLKKMECKQRELSQHEYMTYMMRKMKEGRSGRVPRRPRTQRKSRVMFV